MGGAFKGLASFGETIMGSPAKDKRKREIMARQEAEKKRLEQESEEEQLKIETEKQQAEELAAAKKKKKKSKSTGRRGTILTDPKGSEIDPKEFKNILGS